MTNLEALRAHTIGAAYAAHAEKIKGTLSPGRLADLAVWKGDPLSAKPAALFNLEIAITIVGGKVVYQGEIGNQYNYISSKTSDHRESDVPPVFEAKWTEPASRGKWLTRGEPSSGLPRSNTRRR